MLFFHIISGSLVLIFGVIALLASKGRTLHKFSGNVFFAVMVILSITAAYLEIQLDEFPIMALLALYFTSSSWMVVKRQPAKIGLFEYIAFVGITLVSITFFKWGWDISEGKKVLEGTMPLAFYFVWGSFSAFAAILDFIMIVKGGVSGKHRLARHLWRMCIALLMSILSFLDQDIFPEFILQSGILWAPIVILFLTMFYWLSSFLFSHWRKPKAV